MPRFFEYLSHHPYLAGGTLIVAVIAVAYEALQRARGATGVSNNQAIAWANKGALLLDVRNAEEFASGHMVNARHIELSQLGSTIDSLKKYREKPVVVYCESGQRSAQAVKLLMGQGFTQVFNLAGGLAQWRQEHLPLERGSDTAKGKKS